MALLLVGSADARAKCFSPDGVQPMKAVFADGTTATVLERTSDTLSYRMAAPSGGTTEMRAKAGLFPLVSQANGATTTFEWRPEPPALASLQVGQTIESTATLKSGSGEPRVMTSKLTVLAAEAVTVGECEYPVLKVAQENRFGQASPSLVTRYLHVPSMLTLRTIIGTPVRPGAEPRTIEHRITSLD